MENLKIMQLDKGILHLILNRPTALNALNQALMIELQQTILTAKTDPAVKGILISGAGKGFCAGADINELAALNAQTGVAFARRGQSVFRCLETLGKPSLAAIHGFALGGGCELAMAATLRIATPTTYFAQPEVKLGVIPGFGGTVRLARLVGKGIALDMCLSGRKLSAEEALRYGLVSELIAETELLEKAQDILKNIVQMAPLAVKSVMTVIDQGAELTQEAAFELEAAHFGLCCASADKRLGVDAFLQKRTAEFLGE